MGHNREAPRGRLMRPATIRAEIFHGQVSEWWIRRNLAPDKKVKLGGPFED